MLCPPLDYGWALYILNQWSMAGQAANVGSKPKLVVIGDRDQFCSVESFEKFVGTLPEPRESVIVTGGTS